MRRWRTRVRRGLGGAIGLIALAAFVIPGPASAGAGTTGLDVGPERPVSEVGPTVTQQGRGVEVAFGGGVNLAAWVDGRGGVWAARTSPAGEVLDRTGLPVSGGGWATSPDVAFDGTNFLVVWSGEDGFRARRVSPDGVLLDRAAIEVTRGLTQGEPEVAFDGVNHLVAWNELTDDDSGQDIYGRRVSPAGLLVDPDRRLIAELPGHQIQMDLAFNGTNHLVVWQEGGLETPDVYGILVRPDGTTLTPEGVPISTRPGRQAEPTVTSVGSSFFVAWVDGLPFGNGGPGTSEDIYGTTVDGAGTVLHPSGVPISTGPHDEELPDVTSDGTNVLVAWQDRVEHPTFALRGARVDAADTVLDPSGVDIAAAGQEVALAFDGLDYFAASHDDGTVRGVRLTSAGVVLDPAGIPLALASSSQRELDMAFDGDRRFLTVWSDDRDRGDGTGRGIYGGRVGPEGQRLDGAGFAIAAGDRYESPAVAFDGTDHLVVWADGRTTISGARVSREGTVLDRFDIATTTVVGRTLTAPAVAFGGGTFLVAWAENQPSDYPDALAEVRAARVTTAGVVVDRPGLLLSGGGQLLDVSEPAIASSGSHFLVAWVESVTETFQERIGGALVSAGVATAPFQLVDAPGREGGPDIAWGGGTYLVVWSDERTGRPLDANVFAGRVGPDGTVLDPGGFPISPSPGDQGEPSVAFNGSFLVAWQDRRRDGGFDIHARRVEPDGTVPEPGEFLVAGSPQPETGSAVTAAPGDGRFAVAYERLAIEAPYGTHRAFLRNVSPK